MTEDFNAGRLYADAYIDTKGATRGLQRRLDAETKAIRARIRADIDARGTVAAAKRAAKEASDAAKVRLKAELDSRGLIKSAKEAAAKASAAAKVKIQVEIDQRTQRDVQKQIAALGKGTSAKVDVDVDASTGGAEANIEGMRARQSRAIDIPVRADTSSLSGLARSITQLSRIPAMVGGFYTLGTAIVQIGGGLFAMGSAAVQASSALAMIPNLIGVAGQALGVLIGGFRGVGDAVKAMGQQQVAATAEQAKAGQAAKKQGQDQKAAAAAIRAAQQAVGDAYLQRRRAVISLRDAESDLGRAIEEARESLRDLRMELTGAKNDEEAAANAVAKARMDLQDVEWNAAASPQERREAKAALDEAVNDLEDAKNKRTDIADDLARAEKKGVGGDQGVIAAQRRIRDAKQGVADADRAIIRAEQGVKQARESARQGLADYQAELAQVTPATLALNSAMDNLSPAGQRFANFLYKTLMPRLKQLRFSIQEALLPPLQRGITAAMPMLDTLEDGLVDTGTRLGAFFERLGKSLGTKSFNNDVEKIMGSNNRALTDFGDAAFNVIQILRHLAVVAGPVLLEPFAKWTSALTESGLEATKAGRRSGGLAAFLQRAGDRAAQLGDIFYNLSRALFGLGKAAIDGAGNDLMDAFEKTTKGWADFANSDDGQKRIREFFEAVEPTTKAVGELVASLGEFLAKASEGNTGPLVAFVKTLTAIVDALNFLLGIPGLGPVFGALMALAGIGGALGLVSGMILKMGGNIARLGKATGLTRIIRGIRGTGDAAADAAPRQGILARAYGKVKSAASASGRAVVRGAKGFGGLVKGAARATREMGRLAFEYGKVAARAAGRGIANGARAFAGIVKGAAAATLALGRLAFAYIKVGIQAAISAARQGIARLATLAIAGATKAFAIAQGILNAVMRLNPIVLIISLLLALGVALVVLYRKNETFRRIVQRVWASIKSVISGAWNRIIKPAFNGIRSGLQTLGRWATWLWRNAIGPAWTMIRKAISLAWNYYYKPILRFMWNALKTLGGWFGWLWRKAIKPAWDAIKSAISFAWNRVVKPVFAAFRDGIGRVARAFDAAQKAIGKAWDRIREAVKRPIRAVVNIINDHIISPFNTVSGKLGGPTIGRINNKFSTGGRVGGFSPTPTSDNIPAMLTAEEEVIRVKAARRMRRENPGVMEYINRTGRLPDAFAAGGRVLAQGAKKITDGVVRLAKGGVVWPTIGRATSTYPGHDGVDINQPPGPNAGAPIYAYRSGTISYVGSGRGYGAPAIFQRPSVGPEVVYGHAQSATVRAGQSVRAGQTIGYVGSTGNSSGPHLHFGPPGGTTAGALALLRGATAAPGGGGGGFSVPSFLSTLGSKIAGAVKGGAGWFMDKAKGAISGLSSKYGDTALVKMLQNVPKKLISSAGEKVKSLFGAGEKKYNKRTGGAAFDSALPFTGAGGRLSPDAARGAGKAMMPKSWSFTALNNLWNRESGWRWNADNPSSSAYGIPQSLPGSKMASAGSDWLTNAVTQIRWGLNYIKGRYGNASNAWGHSQSVGWYDRGGSLYPGSTYAYNGTGKIETVFTNENIVQMTKNLARIAQSIVGDTTIGSAAGGPAAMIENLTLTAMPGDVPRVLGDVDTWLRRIEMGGLYADRTAQAPVRTPGP